MKKTLTIILAMALVMGLSVPVFAANETSGKTDLTFTYAAVPSYTVSIPATLTLELGDTNLPITLSDAENLDGKSVVITFEGTQQSADGNQFVTILAPPQGVEDGLFYGILNVNGQQIGGGSKVISPGLHLVALDAEGTANIKINIPETSVPNIVSGANYTGYITFGISLV